MPASIQAVSRRIRRLQGSIVAVERVIARTRADSRVQRVCEQSLRLLKQTLALFELERQLRVVSAKILFGALVDEQVPIVAARRFDLPPLVTLATFAGARVPHRLAPMSSEARTRMDSTESLLDVIIRERRTYVEASNDPGSLQQ